MKRAAVGLVATLAAVSCASDREKTSTRFSLAHARVEVPLRASDVVHVEDPQTRMSVRFSLVGAREVPAARENERTIYPGAFGGGADLVLSLRPEGVEDTLRFVAKPEREATRYDVDVTNVAGLRLVANTLEFLDDGGAPRLRVNAPFVVGADGVERAANLSVHGCALDTDPRAPWSRAVTPPGAARCEVEVSWAGSGAGYPLTVDPAWTATGSLAQIHGYHAAVVLPSKRVMVIGGHFGNTTTEVFDPETETWAMGAPLTTAREGGLGAVVLDSGEVLVAGGRNPSYVDQASTELYDEARGTWVVGQPMANARSFFGMVKLRTSQVLAVGSSAAAELYDPATGQWSPSGTTSALRVHPSASLLADGTVLVAGGSVGGQPTNSAEIFTPPSTWTPAAPMNTPRERHTATELLDGRILVVAGTRGDYLKVEDLLDSAELFDPVTKTWSNTGSITTARYNHAAVLLGDGRVLLTGGGNSGTLTDAQLFEPSVQRWISAGDMTARRWGHTATLLPSGKALIAGPDATQSETFEPVSAGASCIADGECGAGFCVEGMCCDTKCSDPCMACTAAKKGAGADGVCGPMPAGTPHPGCPALPASTCGATGLCDGAGACALQPSGTSCAPDSCDRGVLTKSACTGQGMCKQVAESCAPFACATGAVCKEGACTSDADCADAYSCDAHGSCIPAGCDGDHVVTSTDRTRTDCSPYRCDANGCKASCRSSTDCATPFVCNSEHTCIAPDQARRDGGRAWFCGAAMRHSHSSEWRVIAPLLALLLTLRGRASMRRRSR